MKCAAAQIGFQYINKGVLQRERTRKRAGVFSGLLHYNLK